MILRILAMLAVIGLGPGILPAGAQDLFALARLDPERSEILDRTDGFDLILTISQPVPYRVTLLDEPPRLVLDFREVDFERLRVGGLGFSEAVHAVRHGAIQAGWSRLVIDLAGPYAVETAAMDTSAEDGSARIDVAVRLTDQATFASRAMTVVPDIQDPAESVSTAPSDDGVLTVVLDPGHGGVDPGAIHEDIHEADLVLTFARELREALVRAGGFEVVMTRDADEFVSLEARIDVARRASADVFLSIHADAVSEGIARGAQVYTLSAEASSAASAKLAERHNRADLLAGIDLTGQDDEVARVLMSLARTETTPRTDALADALLDGFRQAGVKLHKRPREYAGFSVLKAPDIPSVLVEIGFMSSPSELKKLQNPDWRHAAATAVVDALQAWAEDDRAQAPLRRQ